MRALADATGFLLDRDKREQVLSREERRRQQEAYRRDLNLQVMDDRGRREGEAKRLQDLEQQSELKSVR